MLKSFSYIQVCRSVLLYEQSISTSVRDSHGAVTLDISTRDDVVAGVRDFKDGGPADTLASSSSHSRAVGKCNSCEVAKRHKSAARREVFHDPFSVLTTKWRV